MIATCPNCHHKFTPQNVMRDSAIAAWVCMVQGGMSNKAFAASRNMSPSAATLYRRLGTAIMEMGLDPVQDPELWADLSNNATANSDAFLRHAIDNRYPLQSLRDYLLEKAAS